jgi:GGDEF domain-containing protein
MDKNKLLAEIEENLQKSNKLYDALRIIDPVNKKVVERKDFIPIDKACAYWYAEALDDNAVAVRAFQDNKYYVKLEQLSASALLITALPIGDDLILELIKNVTDSVIIDDSYYQRFNGLTDSYNNLAYQDILTGLYNRRYVDERLQKDISASIHKQQPFSMIFLDIDNLKEINDHLVMLLETAYLRRFPSCWCVQPEKVAIGLPGMAETNF